MASDVETAKIKSILAGKVYGNIVFLEISTKPNLPDGHCQTNPRWNYAFDPTTEIGKVTLSIALTAYASQRDVYLNGYDNCDVYPGVESLRQLLTK